MVRGYFCRRCRRMRKVTEFAVKPGRVGRDPVCLRCHDQEAYVARAPRGDEVDQTFVRCMVTMRVRPAVDGSVVEGMRSQVPCACLVFRGREAEHLEQNHDLLPTPELVERSFAPVMRGGGEAKDAA